MGGVVSNWSIAFTVFDDVKVGAASYLALVGISLYAALLSFVFGNGDGRFLATLLDVEPDPSMDVVRERFAETWRLTQPTPELLRRPINLLAHNWHKRPWFLVCALRRAGSASAVTEGLFGVRPQISLRK